MGRIILAGLCRGAQTFLPPWLLVRMLYRSEPKKCRASAFVAVLFWNNLVAFWRKLRQSGPEPAFWKAQGLCCGAPMDSWLPVFGKLAGRERGRGRAGWLDRPFYLTKART